MLEELVKNSRSYRSFDESVLLSDRDLLPLIDHARLTPSGMNLQPLRYRILTDEKDRERMLKNCRFASRLGIPLPPAGHHPTAFILIFSDSAVQSPEALLLKDVGIAAQTILLAATERGLGGCMLGSFDPQTLSSDFHIPARYIPRLIIAIGKPDESVRLTDAEDGDLMYYRDENGTHWVPKRKLKDLMI